MIYFAMGRNVLMVAGFAGREVCGYAEPSGWLMVFGFTGEEMSP